MHKNYYNYPSDPCDCGELKRAATRYKASRADELEKELEEQRDFIDWLTDNSYNEAWEQYEEEMIEVYGEDWRDNER